MQKSSREKLRQIWRPNQVKVTFNFCLLLLHLPMIPSYVLEGNEKNTKTPEDPVNASVFRQNCPCKEDAWTWQGQFVQTQHFH